MGDTFPRHLKALVKGATKVTIVSDNARAPVRLVRDPRNGGREDEQLTGRGNPLSASAGSIDSLSRGMVRLGGTHAEGGPVIIPSMKKRPHCRWDSNPTAKHSNVGQPAAPKQRLDSPTHPLKPPVRGVGLQGDRRPVVPRLSSDSETDKTTSSIKKTLSSSLEYDGMKLLSEVLKEFDFSEEETGELDQDELMEDLDYPLSFQDVTPRRISHPAHPINYTTTDHAMLSPPKQSVDKNDGHMGLTVPQRRPSVDLNEILPPDLDLFGQIDSSEDPEDDDFFDGFDDSDDEFFGGDCFKDDRSMVTATTTTTTTTMSTTVSSVYGASRSSDRRLARPIRNDSGS